MVVQYPGSQYTGEPTDVSSWFVLQIAAFAYCAIRSKSSSRSDDTSIRSHLALWDQIRIYLSHGTSSTHQATRDDRAEYYAECAEKQELKSHTEV